MRFLAEELEIRHADIYRNVAKSEWQAARLGLDRRLEGLSNAETLVEIGRLVARIGDAHTALFIDHQDGFEEIYPIELYPVAEGWLVLSASTPYRELTGGVVESFGGRTPVELAAALAPLVPSDNRFGVLEELLDYVVLPQLLSVLGLVEDADALEVVVRHPDGRRVTSTLVPVEDDSVALHLREPSSGHPLWLVRRDEPYWFEVRPNHKEVYLQFNSADVGRGRGERDFEAFCDRLVAAIEENEAERLIIDLRWNDGGSYWRTRHLLSAVLRADRINQPGRLFALLSPYTFSAAVMHALRLEEYTEVTFVGQPTGGQPNHSGTMRRLRLPNSGAVVAYSAVYKSPATDVDHRPYVAPDLMTTFSARDYAVGADPALEALRDASSRRDIGEVLGEWIDVDGLEAAVERYRSLEGRVRNAYRFGERELNGLGYRLLQADRAEEAIAIFELYTREFPWSANAFDSLGEAYSSGGRIEDAIRSFDRAFELDRRFARSRDQALELRDRVR